MPSNATASIANAIATDFSYGQATLRRSGKVIAKVFCTMFPESWFSALQEQARLGDMVEVKLGKPLNRTEQFYMATANHNGFVTGYCSKRMWAR